MSDKIEYEVCRLAELDGWYLDAAPNRWIQDLDEDTLEHGAICRAYSNEYEIGSLAIHGDGLIMGVEVNAAHRRRGIATRMLSELRAHGYRIEHDWENMRDDGAAWACSLNAS